jgi:hypothetical protein
VGCLTPLDAIAAHGIEVSMATRIDRPCGVYLLISSGQIVYVGSTSNIEARIQSHLMRRKPRVNEPARPPKTFDRVIWIRLPREDVLAYEGALIRSLRPPLSVRSPAPVGRDIEILARLGLPPHDEQEAYAELRRAHYTPRPAETRPRLKRARS